MIRARHLLIAVLFLIVVPSDRTPAADDASPSRTTVDEAVRELGIQTEMPRLHLVPVSPSQPITVPPEVAKMVLYAALAVFILVLLYTFITNARYAEEAKAPTVEEAAAVANRMGEAGAEAEFHAGGGAYAEAMHTLLLRSVEELRRRSRVPLARSLTSREILSRLPLEPVAREAFQSLVDRVEITYFGGREPTRDDYELCRKSFDILTGALQEGVSV
ncbi:MAG: DUF4129 domain-containing protein [Planctomycetes bacterium]|nr:DUF4129 domain-containing protein [Planctomycetota bacterium]